MARASRARSGSPTSASRSRPTEPSALWCRTISSRTGTGSGCDISTDSEASPWIRRVSFCMTREVVWDHGVSLPGHSIWLDPLVVRSFAFISHAHTDHARRHKEALLTPQTLALIPEARRPRGWRMLGFGETMRRGEGSVTLHSAGHMLGSAQLHFQDDGWSVLYTGDIKLRQPGRIETFIPRADVLILETTYGRPHFRFGDPDETLELIARWCRLALDSNVTPVLLCHALGKTEEVMLQLAKYGFTFALEKRCAPCAQQYAEAGRSLPDWIELDGEPIGD